MSDVQPDPVNDQSGVRKSPTIVSRIKTWLIRFVWLCLGLSCCVGSLLLFFPPHDSTGMAKIVTVPAGYTFLAIGITGILALSGRYLVLWFHNDRNDR